MGGGALSGLPKLLQTAFAVGVDTIKVYRTLPGSEDYFLVGSHTIDLNAAEPSAAVTFQLASASGVGTALETTDYDPAPADLNNLVALPNGILAGLSGSDLCLCEPFKPYAWPAKYRLPFDNPVALTVIGQSIAVLTKDKPWMVTGTHPDSMSTEVIDFPQACTAMSSVASVPGGIAYSSPDGLAFLGSGGARMLTDGIFTRAQWQAFDPATITGVFHDGCYHFNCAPAGVRAGYVVDFAKGWVTRSTAVSAFSAMVVDPEDDLIYGSIYNGAYSIKKKDTSLGYTMSSTYRTKVFRVESTIRPACMLVIVERMGSLSYQPALGISIYHSNGTLFSTTDLTTDAAAMAIGEFKEFVVRLPSGRLTEFYIEFSLRTIKLSLCAIAESMQELKNVTY